MRLNQLRDRIGSRKKIMRVGRGIGSGKGKTSGRGHKGQKSRSGVSLKGFEGGQMPLHRRLPKRGFTNIFAKSYAVVNLGRIQSAIDQRKLNKEQIINGTVLKQTGVISKMSAGVRILGKGKLKTAIHCEVAGISKAALKMIESLGGTVTLLKPVLKPSSNTLETPLTE